MAEQATHELRVLDLKGDTKITWNKNNIDEVSAARKMFAELKAKGFSAFSIGGLGKKDTLINEFDPVLEKIVMTPRIVGG